MGDIMKNLLTLIISLFFTIGSIASLQAKDDEDVINDISLGIDRLLDMTRTAVNVTGDAAISCVVASSEKKINYNYKE